MDAAREAGSFNVIFRVQRSESHWGGPPRSRARLQLGCVLLWHPAGVSGVPGLPSSTIHVVLVLTLRTGGKTNLGQFADALKASIR
jgi:hypothetical protein